MTHEAQQLLRAQLREHLSLLGQAVEALRYSEARCRPLVGGESHTQEDAEHLEALTSRFARTVDMFTQKTLKTLFVLLGEDAATFLDAANRAEKIGLIERAEDLVALRTLRNEIAHEYATDALGEIYSETLAVLPTLYTAIEKIVAYAEEKFFSAANFS